MNMHLQGMRDMLRMKTWDCALNNETRTEVYNRAVWRFSKDTYILHAEQVIKVLQLMNGHADLLQTTLCEFGLRSPGEQRCFSRICTYAQRATETVDLTNQAPQVPH